MLKYYIFNPHIQHNDLESEIKSILKDLLTELRKFKFIATLVLLFKNKENGEKT